MRIRKKNCEDFFFEQSRFVNFIFDDFNSKNGKRDISLLDSSSLTFERRMV